MIGRKLSHYEIITEIKRGGMGEIYRARDTRLNREVAIKVLPRSLLRTDPASLPRFVQEAQATAALDHPYIATVFEIGDEHGVTFIAMELIRGRELAEHLADRPLDAKVTVNFAIEIAEGLAFAHEKGIVHRDLKPANLMVTDEGHIKIIDFGIAKLTQPLPSFEDNDDTAARAPTQAGAVKGTFSYMSPEQTRGEPLDHRCDVFSFGLVLHEMLSGHNPLRKESLLETVHAIVHLEPAPLPESVDRAVAERLQPIIDRCLKKDAAERYQSARELVDELKECRAQIESAKYREQGAVTQVAARPRSAIVVGLLSLVTIALAAVIWNLWPPPRESAVVLPWEYDGSESTQKLSQLIPPALSIRLSELEGLDVVPFANSRNYDSDDEPETVLSQLGVSWVIQGRLRSDAGAIAATVNLLSIDGAAEGWPREIRAGLDEPVELADRIADSVAQELGFGGPSTPRQDQRALEHYLEGQSYLLGWDVEESYRRAEMSFRLALESDADFAPAHAGLARALWSRYEESTDADLVAEAFDEAQQAVLLAPNLADPHVAMGEVLLGRGRAVEAGASFERALELAPADDSVCRRIADAYAALGREDDAAAMYQRAIDLRPGYWGNYYEKGNFYLYTNTSQLEEAKPLFQNVIRLRPESDVGYHGLASAFLFSGDFDSAAPLLQAAIRLNPNSQSGAAHNNLGFVYYASGQFELALTQFRLAVEKQPNSIHLIGLADTYRQLQRPEAIDTYARAVEILRAELEVNPAAALARGYLSQALAGAGNCPAARDEASRAAPLDRDLPLVHYLVAVTHSICGDDADAVTHVRLALLGGVTLDVETSPDLQPYLEDPSVVEALSPSK